MALARDRHRDGGTTRLARWVTRGLMTLGGTGLVVLASAGFAASASADDGETLVGEVVDGIAGTVEAAAPEAVAVPQEAPVADVTAPVSREAEPIVQQTVEPVVRDVVVPVASEAAEPAAAVVEPVVRDVVAPAVREAAVPAAAVVEPVVRDVVAPAIQDVAPVVETVAAAVDASEPGLGLAPETDVGPVGASPDDDVSSEAGRSLPVAMPPESPLLSAGTGAAPDLAAATGDRSTTPSGLPASAPASSSSLSTSHGAGSPDADLARGLAVPANDLSLSRATAPPSAVLEVLLEISVAPD
ncbi:hypothetical protein KZX45_09995 [Georgenia sp. EYE_87]|uniref:hypothetical protein n=1 Tax=Georgenia sp. EYE_87 TaxID=2853448 RepID=UPI00200616BE|nr:hypothetical protein [Georgenia sp. EYE_87]MCK6210873.1 hypothetical protein [Georgenia sp. EYE_87]